MPRFVNGADRHHSALVPHHLDDDVSEDNTARVVGPFVEPVPVSPRILGPLSTKTFGEIVSLITVEKKAPARERLRV